MANSFIENLRMNSIFPSNGSNPSPLIGMPDFYSGRQVPPYYGIRQQEQQQQQEPQLQQVAQRIVKPQSQFQQNPATPENTAYKAPKSDEYGTNILMGTTEYDKQQRAKELLGQKTAGTQATARGTLAVKQQLANVAKFKAEHPGLKAVMTKGGNVQLMNPITGEMIDTGVDTGTLTEQDKIDLTGEKSLEQIGARGDIQRELQGTRGSQALEQIGARIAGNKDIANIRFNDPTQQKAAQATAIQQIQTTRPDLAKYLVKDSTTGVMSISPDTPMNELSMIQNIISPKNNKDINLPPSRTTTKTSPSKSTTLTVDELKKKYGG